MYKDQVVAVVVPAFNEDNLIGQVIETMPDFVDHIIVVDDCSQDKTAQVAQHCPNEGDGRNCGLSLRL